MKNYLLLIVLLIMTTTVVAQNSFLEHKTEKGETAYSISQKYKITLQDLYQYNPEIQKGINENQIVKIPVFSNSTQEKTEGVVHIVGPQETLFGLSKKYAVSVDAITTANKDVLNEGLKIGQRLVIPVNGSVASGSKNEEPKNTKREHTVLPKESLFSIARIYNVSVEDLGDLNKELLIDGLKSGQVIRIPNKKKTLDGRVRVINNQTIFHTVAPKETKYAIAKRYGITIEQLESQNPEIINGLVEGNKLAINKEKINPENDTEELMIALADKQVALEKGKAKGEQIQDLKDRLTIQQEMNQKIIKINNLKFDLNSLDWGKNDENSANKLKLILEANKNIQEVLMAKLDSLIVYMDDDLSDLKGKKLVDLEETKKLEKESYKNISQTNEMSNNLKRELANNRKNYADLMNKVERITVAENQEYKKKIREREKDEKKSLIEETISIEEINKYKAIHDKNNKQNEALLVKIDSLGTQKKIEVKRQISKATFYSREARAFDDKLSLLKLKRHQTAVLEKRKEDNSLEAESSSSLSPEEVSEIMAEDPNFYANIMKNIQTIDNLGEIEDGYYLVLNDFEEAMPRDQFIIDLIDSGDFNASFFFNVNTLSYFVFSDYSQEAEGLLGTLKRQKNNPNYKNVKIVKLEYRKY